MTKVHLANVIIGNMMGGEKVRNRLLEHFEHLGKNGALKLQDIADAYMALHAEISPLGFDN